MDEELNVLASSIQRSYDPGRNEFSEVDFFHDNENYFPEYYLRVFDKDRHPIYATPLCSVLTFNVPLEENIMEKGYTLKTKVTEKIPVLNPGPEGETTFRLICRQLFFGQQRVGWVVVGLSIERIEDSMENLLFVLLGSILGSILLLVFSRLSAHT